MDIKQMLNDTVDQQNHARWTGSMYALKDSIDSDSNLKSEIDSIFLVISL